MDTNIYNDWKPFRNYLRQTDVWSDLYVIHAYAVRRMMLNTQSSFPSDIEPHPWLDKPYAFLPWELETLAREVIISAEINPNAKYSFKKSKDLATGINHLKRLENLIAKKFINDKNIRQEVSVRLAHRQFKYQEDSPNLESLVRYAKIFNYPDIAELVKQKIGLYPKQISIIGGALFGNTLTYFQTLYNPTEFSLPDVTWDDYQVFVDKFALSISELRSKLINSSERRIDDTFLYAYHSMYNWPLIKDSSEDGTPFVTSPLPVLLYWRISSGLYYDIYNLKGFDNAFGNAFEAYVGEALKTIHKGSSSKIFPGEENTPKSPNRTDWIIDQKNSALFIESKTKRLTMGAKVTLMDDDELFKQLDILGDAVKQSYLSYFAYRDNLHRSPRYKFDASKKYYLAVTTLERWHLMGEQLDMLDEIVKDKLETSGIDPSIIIEVPYIIAPITDLELLAFLARKYSITEIVQPYIDDAQTKGWEFHSYLNEKFKSKTTDYIYPFNNEYDTLYGNEIGKRFKKLDEEELI